MDHETPDVIEAQMAETRQSLTEKVAALEDSVVGTVQNATTAVADTVQSVKDAVGDTVESVKDNVASALDVGKHVRDNPWGAVGTSALAGLITGLLVFRKASASIPATMATAAPSYPRAAMEPAQPREPGVLDAIMSRIGGEVKKLGESVIERVSSELSRVVDDGVPRIAELLNFAPADEWKAESDKMANTKWNGTVDSARRAS